MVAIMESSGGAGHGADDPRDSIRFDEYDWVASRLRWDANRCARRRCLQKAAASVLSNAAATCRPAGQAVAVVRLSMNVVDSCPCERAQEAARLAASTAVAATSTVDTVAAAEAPAWKGAASGKSVAHARRARTRILSLTVVGGVHEEGVLELARLAEVHDLSHGVVEQCQLCAFVALERMCWTSQRTEVPYFTSR